MNERIFHAVASDSLREEVLGNEVLPLVKELNHAYGLKVYAKSDTHGYRGFAVCNEEGFAIAKVFFHDGAYHYHAPYQQKARGSDEFDRRTYRSTKLSTLMSTLKKANITTTTEEVLTHNRRRLDNLVGEVSVSFEDKNKDSFPAVHAQKLLSLMVEGKTLDSLAQTDRDLYLDILDEYKKIDIMKVVKREGIESMFRDCYLVLGDVNGHYIVGESTCEYVSDYASATPSLRIKPTTKFKRVKDLTEYPTVLTALTMLKVNLGDEFRPFAHHHADNSLLPLGDKYVSDLDIAYVYERRSSEFDMVYSCISK